MIEQAQPDTMYVPYYDPAIVYGEWPYAEYPPYYFGYPSYIGAGVIAAGLAFGAGWAIGRWGNYWGGGCNWGNHNLYVNHHNKINNIGNNWQHNPAHRQGVKYNNANVANRFGNNNLKAGAGDRMDFRGRDGQQVLRPDRIAPAIGGRPRGDRAGIARVIVQAEIGPAIAPVLPIAPRAATAPRAAVIGQGRWRSCQGWRRSRQGRRQSCGGSRSRRADRASGGGGRDDAFGGMSSADAPPMLHPRAAR